MTAMNQSMISDEKLFTVKDPISALTHFAGAVGAVAGMPLLLLKGAVHGNSLRAMVSYAVFMLSMILLYSASASYHSFSVNYRVNKVLKKMDHAQDTVMTINTELRMARKMMPIFRMLNDKAERNSR